MLSKSIFGADSCLWIGLLEDLFRVGLLRCEKTVDNTRELVSRGGYRGACSQSPFCFSIEFAEMILRTIQALCSKTESDGSPVLYVPRL